MSNRTNKEKTAEAEHLTELEITEPAERMAERYASWFGIYNNPEWDKLRLAFLAGERLGRLKALQLSAHCKDKDEWVSLNRTSPNLIEGKNYSENVLAWCNNELKVMCYCYIDSEDDEERGYVWADCNYDINGDAEFDDDYDVTHWQPLPSPPTK